MASKLEENICDPAFSWNTSRGLFLEKLIFTHIFISEFYGDIIWIRALIYNPAGNHMFKVSNRNTTTGCEICSKLTIKIPWYLYCSLWTYLLACSTVSIVNFEQVTAAGMHLYHMDILVKKCKIFHIPLIRPTFQSVLVTWEFPKKVLN